MQYVISLATVVFLENECLESEVNDFSVQRVFCDRVHPMKYGNFFNFFSFSHNFEEQCIVPLADLMVSSDGLLWSTLVSLNASACQS